MCHMEAANEIDAAKKAIDHVCEFMDKNMLTGNICVMITEGDGGMN